MGPSAPANRMPLGGIRNTVVRLVVSIVAVVAVIVTIASIHVQPDRVLSAALNLFLAVVLVASIRWGSRYAILLSLLSALSFSWLLPPAGHFHLSDGRVWTLLTACLVTGLIASQLSSRLRRAVLEANERHAAAVAAQQRFADLVNSVEGIVWEADAKTFVFSFVSEQAERMLGYPRDQWLRDPTFWNDHLHPEDRDWAVQFCQRAPAEQRSHDFEYRMIAANGRVVWMRDLVTLVVENGHATRLRGVMVDVTKRKASEEAVRDQAKLLDLTHDAVLVRDMNRTITYWNRGAEELYGWPADEALGHTPYELLKIVFPKPLEEIESEVMRTGRWEGELAQTKKNGTTVVVASRWALARDDKGAPIAIVATNNDITARKRAEQAREEFEEQSRAAFENNPTMYFIVDETGNIVNVNTFGAEQLGYSVDELIGEPVLNVFYELDKEAVQGHATACFKQPGQMMRWEARKIRKDGTMIWVRETANAVFLKKQRVLLVVCENITEQRRAEDAARVSEKQLRDLIETIPVMVFSIRPDGSTEFASRNWQDYAGLSLEDTNLAGWQATIHPDDLDTHLNKWSTSLASGQVFENEVRHRDANGEYRWFLVRAVPLRDEQGNVLRWYGALTDIEDRKRAEALLSGEKRVLEMVARGDSLAQILDSLCRLVEEQASGVLTSILLVEGNRLRHGGAPSLPKAYTEAIDGLVIGPAVGSCGTAVYSRKQVIVEDIATDPLWADYRAAALPHCLRACWSTPIFSSQDEVIATFAMYYRQPRSPSVLDQRVIEQITHLAGVAIERKLTQEALRRNQTYLAEAQRLSHTGSWAYEPGTRKAFYWSEEMFRIWGFDPKQGPPDNEAAWQRIHPEDLSKMQEYLEEAREARLRSEVVADHRIVLPDGTVKHIHGISHPVFNEAGQVVEYVGTAVDVTKRKFVEEALRRSEAYLAEAQRLSKTGSWAYDPRSDQMIYCSEELYEIFGVHRQDRLPSIEVLLERVHPEDRERVRAESVSADHRRTEHTLEYRLLLPDGGVRHVLSMQHPVFDQMGELVEVIGTTVDVTDRKRAEAEIGRLRQLEADLARINRMSTMGELTASLAHEVNQPIAAAVTNANTSVRWLAGEIPNIDEAREAAKRAAKDATRAAEIITRIRSVFKKGALQRDLVDLNQVVNDVLALLRDEATKWQVGISSELAANVPPLVADRVQLQQVLMNLMVNSIDAMKGVDGPRKLTVTSQHEGGEQVLVAVSDSGIGLPPDIGRIFDAFFTTKPQGTGMGLAISRSIIESHGGRLWANSNPSGGATLYFTLPIQVEVRV